MRPAVLIPVGIAIVSAVALWFGFWGLYEAAGPPPCETWWGAVTGPQLYEGERIECFHGHVVEVRP